MPSAAPPVATAKQNPSACQLLPSFGLPAKVEAHLLAVARYLESVASSPQAAARSDGATEAVLGVVGVAGVVMA